MRPAALLAFLCALLLPAPAAALDPDTTGSHLHAARDVAGLITRIADARHAASSPAAAAATSPDNVAFRQAVPLAVTFDPGNGYRAIVRVGDVLGDRRLEQAARSGLPIRVRIRTELWRDRFFDQLVDSASWSTVIVFEPLGQQFFVRSLPAGGGARRFDSFNGARAVVESEYLLGMRPSGPGRYYYTTTLQIETLSLGDLEELERWLQGELQPAVSGQRSVPGALTQGARRLMLRLLDLPQRRIDVRSDRFTIG